MGQRGRRRRTSPGNRSRRKCSPLPAGSSDSRSDSACEGGPRGPAAFQARRNRRRRTESHARWDAHCGRNVSRSKRRTVIGSPAATRAIRRSPTPPPCPGSPRGPGAAAVRALGPAVVEDGGSRDGLQRQDQAADDTTALTMWEKSVAAFTLGRIAGIGCYAERGSPRAPSRASCVDASGLRPLPDCRREALPLSQRSQTSNLTRNARPSGTTARPVIAKEETSGSTGAAGGTALAARGIGLSATRGRLRQRRADQRAPRRTVTATGSRALERWRVRGRSLPGALGGLYGRMATYARRDIDRCSARDGDGARGLAQGELRSVARPVGRHLRRLRLSGRCDHLYPG